MRTALTAMAIAAGFAAQSDAAELEITVTGGDPATGQILAGVFRDAESFLETAIATAAAPVDSDGQSHLIFDLPPGTYAVAVTYDLNGNGVMDRRAFGRPAEPFGFSNNARARFGPPAFDRAAVPLTDTGATIAINLTQQN